MCHPQCHSTAQIQRELQAGRTPRRWAQHAQIDDALLLGRLTLLSRFDAGSDNIDVFCKREGRVRGRRATFCTSVERYRCRKRLPNPAPGTTGLRRCTRCRSWSDSTDLPRQKDSFDGRHVGRLTRATGLEGTAVFHLVDPCVTGLNLWHSSSAEVERQLPA